MKILYALHGSGSQPAREWDCPGIGQYFRGVVKKYLVDDSRGQGRTIEECREDLAEAIALILEDRREDGLRGVPPEAVVERVRGSQAQFYASEEAPSRLTPSSPCWSSRGR